LLLVAPTNASPFPEASAEFGRTPRRCIQRSDSFILFW
jgi:hypothetical protein